MNFRHLQHDDPFKKWGVVTVECVPAMQGGRVESWKPVRPRWSRSRTYDVGLAYPARLEQACASANPVLGSNSPLGSA